MDKKKGLPEYGETVLCTTTRITPFAAWCTLDEYENEDGSPIEGMIHISQVAGKWIKDIRDFVKPNKQYMAKVIKIDYEKGHLNLSIKRVSKFDKKEKMEDYRRDKRSNGMVMQVAKIVGKGDVQKEIVDKLEKIHKDDSKKFDVFTAFEEVNENPEIVKEAGIKKDWAEALMGVVESNFRIKERTLKVKLKLESKAPDGVKTIKKVLSELEKIDGIEVTYISAPEYRVEMKTKEPKVAEKTMRDGVEKAIKELESAGGSGSYELVR